MYLTTLQRSTADSVFVRLSVCHTREPRLQGSRYRNTFLPYDRGMFLVFFAKFSNQEFGGST